MAKFFLINTTRVGSEVLYAGDEVDDAFVDVSKITASGGTLWPAADATVATAAARASASRLKGDVTLVDGIMAAAASASANAAAVRPAPFVITGALSTVADAPAKAVLTSMRDGLVAGGYATDGTT